MRRLLIVSAIVIALFGSMHFSPAKAVQTETTYTVQPGDTLFRIGLRYGLTTAQLASYNGIANPNLIFVGEVIRIPAGGGVVNPPTVAPPPGATQPPPTTGSTYVVQPGDSLYRIAQRFGVTLAALIQANGIVNPNLIYVGQVLRIPGGSGPIVVGPTVAPPPGATLPPAPPPGSGAFELGGQILNLDGNTQNALRTAKMGWVKRQARVGDNLTGAIQDAHNAGFKILFSIVGDKNSVLNSGYFDQYANYTAQVAGQGADAIEVWNEMNLDREWPNGQINAATYTQMLAKAYAAIKGVNAKTIVISGAPAPTGAESAFPGAVVNDDRYYAGMAAAGAARYADCIGVHYNEGIVSPTQTSGDPRGNYPTRYYATMLNRALASFPGKQACFTELGFLSPEGYGALPGNFAWAANTTVAQQAQWLGQAVSAARAGGRVRLFIVFNIDFKYYGQDDPQAGYAIIRQGGGCPACSAIGGS